jgi:hypothetical protein
VKAAVAIPAFLRKVLLEFSAREGVLLMRGMRSGFGVKVAKK